MDPFRIVHRPCRGADFACPRDPQGIDVGFGYLKMSARDMLELGNLFLAGGVWKGKQPVPQSWVEAATGPVVSTAGGPGGEHDGYQWWVVTTAGDHAAFAAIGYGGQMIEVVPDLRLVAVASTSIDDNSTFDSRTWEFMVSTVIVPAFDRNSN